MNIQDFDRMVNPLDVQEGLDELPGFVPDEAYISLRDECAKAYEFMQMQRTHRFSMADLKAVIDRFEGLARRADQVMRYYGANDGFICRYMELCERYAELEGYLVRAEEFIARRISAEFWTISAVVAFKDAHSAMYDNTYFVEEFKDFRWNYDWTREAALFLELDSANARSAMWDWNVSCEYKWIRQHSELFDRINEGLGLYYYYCCADSDPDDYFDVYRFRISKAELKDMLTFQAKIGELRHEHWKRRIT
jgi:hypothetical protein